MINLKNIKNLFDKYPTTSTSNFSGSLLMLKTQEMNMLINLPETQLCLTLLTSQKFHFLTYLRNWKNSPKPIQCLENKTKRKIQFIWNYFTNNALLGFQIQNFQETLLLTLSWTNARLYGAISDDCCRRCTERIVGEVAMKQVATTFCVFCYLESKSIFTHPPVTFGVLSRIVAVSRTQSQHFFGQNLEWP